MCVLMTTSTAPGIDAAALQRAQEVGAQVVKERNRRPVAVVAYAGVDENR
jgi:hypothetical protein